MTLGSGILGGGILGGVISQPSPQSKKIEIRFYNPTDESNIDHLEVWWKLGIGGTYAQLGADIPFVSGTADYLVEDLDVNDGDILYYQARAYNASGDYSVIEDYIQVGGANIVPMTDDFLGYKRVDITSISPGIQVIDKNDDAPKVLMLSSAPTTALGTRTLTSDPIIPYKDLEFKWLVTHSDGSPIEDLEGLIDPRDGSAVNPYVDQVSPEFTCVIREAGDYKVTMTVRGQNGLSDAVVSTTEYLFTVTESTAAHYWYANAGDDLNDGLDPHGFSLTTAVYTDSTKELTQTGAWDRDWETVLSS